MAWLRQAQVGDSLDIGGPRGSKVVPDDFDWYLLIGDESALPAIGRRVEELRAGAPVTSIVVVADSGETQSFATRAAWTPVWRFRDGADAGDATLLRSALAGVVLPPGAEAAVARARRHRRGARPSQGMGPRRRILAARPGGRACRARRLMRADPFAVYDPALSARPTPP